MVVMLHQWEEAQEGDLWCHVASGLHQWEEAQEGDLWLSCCIYGRRLRRVTCGCHVASGLQGSGGHLWQQWEEAQEGEPVVVMLHQDCINGRRLRRVTCGCHVASGLHQWEEAQEGDLWLSCCIRTASMGGGSGG